MRYLVILSGSWDERVETVAGLWRDRMHLLEARGDTFEFIAPSDRDEQGEKTNWGWKTFYIPTHPRVKDRMLYFVQALIRGIQRRKHYDAIWAESPQYSGAAASILGKLFGKMSVIYMQGSTFEAGGLYYKSWKNKIYRFLVGLHIRITATLADHFLVVYPKWGREELIPNGANPAKLHHFPNNVDTSKFYKFPRAPERFLLWVGRMIPFKGAELAVQGFAQSGYDGKLVMVGGKEPTTMALAKELGANVEFVGWISREEVGRLLARAQGFIATSKVCNHCYSTMEAMFSEVPIVATDVGDTRDLLNEGNAIFCKPTPESLALAIRKLDIHPPNTTLARLDLNRYIFSQEKWVEMYLKAIGAIA